MLRSCSVKTNLLSVTNLARLKGSGDRLEDVLRHVSQAAMPEWEDAEGRWWKTTPARIESSQRTLAATFHRYVVSHVVWTVFKQRWPHVARRRCRRGKAYRILRMHMGTVSSGLKHVLCRFVNAYLCVIADNVAHPHMGDACSAIIAGLEAARNDGQVPMSAVVESFRLCPGAAFHDTLHLLNWAGHLAAFTTLRSYKTALMYVVKAYLCHQEMWRRVPNLKVRTRCHTRLGRCARCRT